MWYDVYSADFKYKLLKCSRESVLIKLSKLYAVEIITLNHNLVQLTKTFFFFIVCLFVNQPEDCAVHIA